MTNYFKWQLEYPEEKFLKDRWDTIRAGDNLYSVYWLYNITGDEWLLELGKKIQRNTANWRIDSNLPNGITWISHKDSANLRPVGCRPKIRLIWQLHTIISIWSAVYSGKYQEGCSEVMKTVGWDTSTPARVLNFAGW